MSDYYYLEDENDESGMTPILGDDYIAALFSIARKHGLNITNKMIFKEAYGKEIKRKKKTNLYIDGTNLFAGQHELFGPKKHLSFIFLIQEIQKLVPINEIFFYSSYMNLINRNKVSQERKHLLVAEALFYREVRSIKNLTFYKGHRSPTSGKEKGVDVHLSVDIVRDVFQGKCDQIVIITGDADLIYPLEIVKMLNISSCAIFLPNRFSLEMAYKADKAFVLNLLNKFKENRKLPSQLKIIGIKKPRMINIRGK